MEYRDLVSTLNELVKNKQFDDAMTIINENINSATGSLIHKITFYKLCIGAAQHSSPNEFMKILLFIIFDIQNIILDETSLFDLSDADGLDYKSKVTTFYNEINKFYIDRIIIEINQVSVDLSIPDPLLFKNVFNFVKLNKSYPECLLMYIRMLCIFFQNITNIDDPIDLKQQFLENLDDIDDIKQLDTATYKLFLNLVRSIYFDNTDIVNICDKKLLE